MSQDLDRTSTDTAVVSDPQPATDAGPDHHGYDDEDFLPRRGRGRGREARGAMPSDGEAAARKKFGGVNWGASFFGWLVAVAVAALLTGAAGAAAAVLGATAQIRSDAEAGSGTAGLVTAGVLLVVLLLGYYCGGYVAGRMSRFDGSRQGLGVWVVNLLAAAVAVGLGLVLGGPADLRDRMDLSGFPFSTDQVAWQILVGAGLLVLAGTLLAAVLGGSVGHRYHRRVDRVVHD
ncbi:hypothetical protein GCM10009844_09710 [Nocardioides koreensis]|uniref:Major facilitator superfamily (MFS) profile domain-containing protein n=1 Tax=Nocardioides koreensis TaxID=433651 RepID=A0ABP5L7D8_9ACTN